MTNGLIRIESRGKIKEIMHDLTEAQETIFRCYRELEDLGVLVFGDETTESATPTAENDGVMMWRSDDGTRLVISTTSGESLELSTKTASWLANMIIGQIGKETAVSVADSGFGDARPIEGSISKESIERVLNQDQSRRRRSFQ